MRCDEEARFSSSGIASSITNTSDAINTFSPRFAPKDEARAGLDALLARWTLANLADEARAHGKNAMAPAVGNADTALAACANRTLHRIASQRKAGADTRPFFLSVGFHKRECTSASVIMRERCAQCYDA